MLSNSHKKVCMVAYTFYECDNRVRRYAETLASRGDQVDVIALRGNAAGAIVERDGIRVFGVQKRDYNESSKWSYVVRLVLFLWRASWMLTRLHRKYRYDVVHIHNMPDFLVYAAWYPKLTGAKLILDIHDIVPELFVNKFHGARLNRYYVSLLKRIERWSASFVAYVIISNDLWRDKVVARSVESERCKVFLNHVDLKIFHRRCRTRMDGRVIVLFPGSLQWHQGLDIAIRAFAQFRREVPNSEFHIYGGGGGDQKSVLIELTRSLGVADSVRFSDGVALEKIPQLIADADLGVVPKRADSFGNEAYSTKIMEFMSQGLPVVASRTKIDSFYFDESTVHFFESGDSDAMAKAMLEVYRDKDLRARLIQHGLEYSEQNSWERKKQEYLDLIDSLSTPDFGCQRGVANLERENTQVKPTPEPIGTLPSVSPVPKRDQKSETVQLCE